MMIALTDNEKTLNRKVDIQKIKTSIRDSERVEKIKARFTNNVLSRRQLHTSTLESDIRSRGAETRGC